LIATKFGSPIDGERQGGGSAAYVQRACEDSLRRLGTDRIDLYQIHFPDANTPLEETIRALDELVRVGKVREIGCSNFTAEMIEAGDRISTEQRAAPFASVQNEYSLLRRGPEKNGVLEACKQYGLAFIPYFPLASGMLTGKYRRDEPPPQGTRLAGMPADRQKDAFAAKNFDRVEALEQWATDHGHSLLDLAFAWLLARSTVASVIAGATKPEQVRANASAASWNLTASEEVEVDAVIERVKS
jgi:aryl-alcohol dehydrogenase-like predicted oxidoreductase